MQSLSLHSHIEKKHPGWPEGFFDQGPRVAESILRAAAAKKKLQREK